MAIIVGTIDMTGSRLLFEGYGISRGMRPYHAGLLGADSVFVLDEAHLCPPFQALLHAIATKDDLAPHSAEERSLIPRFHLLTLSATGRKIDERAFRLSASDAADEIVAKRLCAKKRVSLEEAPDTASVLSALIDRAQSYAGSDSRILIFCDRREDARKVAQGLRKALNDRKGDNVELLTGARRVHERTALAAKLEAWGFIAGSKERLPTPVFLVATSAGEVGVDLDADHMVCDLVSFERMVQRLGRVNRRGEGDANVSVFFCPPKASKGEPPNPPSSSLPVEPVPPEKPERASSKDVKEDYARRKKIFSDAEKAFKKAKTASEKEWQMYEKQLEEYLRASLPYREFQARRKAVEALSGDGSPNGIAALNKRRQSDGALDECLSLATSSEPLRPALTRALVDAWSMTSLQEHSGRPEIEPWLRGWADKDEPETTVTWREHLPWRESEREPSTKEVEAFFEAAPPHLSESLEALTREVSALLTERAREIVRDSDSEKAGPAGGARMLFPPDAPAALLLDRSGKAKAFANGPQTRIGLTARELAELDETGRKALLSSLAGSQLIVHRRFGGLDRYGLLDKAAEQVALTIDHDWPEHDLKSVTGFRVRIDGESLSEFLCVRFTLSLQTRSLYAKQED
ncbi:helicase-related protein, partial [Methylolobus aquaticus]